MAHAEVLTAAGDKAGAVAVLREALELFERKQNVVKAEQTRALLAELEPFPPPSRSSNAG